jgi:hypothetical protein
VTYATDRLFEEVAYVAYHFHWPMDAILDLEHPLRLRFVEEIGRINQEGHTAAAVTCPSCSHNFTVDVAGEQRLGES